MIVPNVGIIGTGRLGTRLAEELIRNQTCEKLLLWNRSRRRLKGSLLSLSVYASIVNSPTVVAEMQPRSLSALDLVVIAIKDNYDPRDLKGSESFPNWFPVDVRTVGLRRDLPLIRGVCEMLKHFSGIVIVLTNPLDIVTSLVQGWLPKARVYGLGVSLDAARIAFALAERGIPCVRGQDCMVGGEHGKGIVPLKSMWRKDLLGSCSADTTVREAMKRACSIGPTIVRDLGYTLHDCAAVFSSDIERILDPGAHVVMCLSTVSEGAAVGIPMTYDSGLRRLIEYRSITQEEMRDIAAARQNVACLVQRIRGSKIFSGMVT